MAPKVKRSGKKAVRGRPRMRRARVVRRGLGVPEKASMTEVFGQQNLSSNLNYSTYNTSLSQCPRAVNVAKAYQYYRIKRITFVIKPLMDTFVQGGVTVPYLYYLIDRTRQYQNGFTLNQLKAAGCKPRRIDEKTVRFSFTPSVLTDTFDNTPGAQTFVQYKMSPWLPCKDISQVGIWNASTIDHGGIVWRVEQTSGPIGYMIERQIEFEFKKPITPPGEEPLEVPQDFDTLP